MEQDAKDITTIDFTIKADDGLYADVCWQRRRAFYCFGSADTREDGDVRSDEAVFDKAVNQIAEILKANVCDNVSSVSCRFVLTYSDGKTETYCTRELSQATILALLDVVSTAADEFAYLDNFRHYLSNLI